MIEAYRRRDSRCRGSGGQEESCRGSSPRAEQLKHSCDSSWPTAHTSIVTKTNVPRHQLGLSWGPDGTRVRARDLGVDHDTFLERKSMDNVKNDGIEDDARKEKHDGLRGRGTRTGDSQGSLLPGTTELYTAELEAFNWSWTGVTGPASYRVSKWEVS